MSLKNTGIEQADFEAVGFGCIFCLSRICIGIEVGRGGRKGRGMKQQQSEMIQETTIYLEVVAKREKMNAERKTERNEGQTKNTRTRRAVNRERERERDGGEVSRERQRKRRDNMTEREAERLGRDGGWEDRGLFCELIMNDTTL